MTGMTAWDFPAIIIAAVVVAVAIGWWLIRLADAPQRVPEFDCGVCGRRARARYVAEWRYCPYCGAPRLARGTHELPETRRSGPRR